MKKFSRNTKMPPKVGPTGKGMPPGGEKEGLREEGGAKGKGEDEEKKAEGAQDLFVLTKTLMDELQRIQARLAREEAFKDDIDFEKLERDWTRTLEDVGPGEEREMWERNWMARVLSLREKTLGQSQGQRWMHQLGEDYQQQLEKERLFHARVSAFRREWEEEHGYEPTRRGDHLDSDDLWEASSPDIGLRFSGLSELRRPFLPGIQPTLQRPLEQLLDSDQVEMGPREMEQMFNMMEREVNVKRSILNSQHRLIDVQADSAHRRIEAEIDLMGEKLRDTRLRIRRRRSPSPVKNRHRAPSITVVGRPSSAKFEAAGQQPEPGGTDEPTQQQPMEPQPKHAKASLRQEEWATFRALARQEECEAVAIDVLLGEPALSYEDTYAMVFGPRHHRLPKDAKPAAAKPPTSKSDHDLLPERIRIHSSQLLSILKDLRPDGDDRTLSSAPAVFVRPFKMFSYYENALRDRCDQLAKGLAVSAAAATADGSRDSGQPELPALDGGRPEQAAKSGGPDDAVALDHLRCLLEFMDEYMAKKLDHLKSRNCVKIAFPDVWHLFRPGIHVVGADGKQAYRVISVTSVGHKVIPPFYNYRDKDAAKSEETPITIVCSYIDFDGRRLGPVAETFVIKRFDGRRPVVTLPVFPLRFHPLDRADDEPKIGMGMSTGITGVGIDGGGDGDKSPSAKVGPLPPGKRLMDMLVARGKKFVDVATFKNLSYTGKHMYCSGLTLETKDDVESEVVVDFETALSIKDHKDKGWAPKIESILALPANDKHKTDPCNADCCKFESVHDDSYVEELRNSDYIRDLMPTTRDKQITVAIEPWELTDVTVTDDTFTADELAIMSSRVFAYILRSRKWGESCASQPPPMADHTLFVLTSFFFSSETRPGRLERSEGAKYWPWCWPCRQLWPSRN